MQQADRIRFRAVMAGMAEMYQRELSPTLLDAYWLALRDWPLADFEAGAAQLMATSKFMPRPADWNELRKAALPTAGEAWERAIAACLGWRNGTATVDPLTDRVVRMVGGYQHLALEPLDTQHFTRNKFLELYDELAETEGTREAVPQIAGPPQTPRLTAGSFATLGWSPPPKEPA
ncbi:MAG: hypothetical protein IT514_14865 [Burkholderiales bacterium]|nr:hypothetical protein [Burkholderiales bacterium]